MSIVKSPILTLGVAPPHAIDQSIRFNALDNPYMSKTFSGTGSPKNLHLVGGQNYLREH